MNANYTNRIKDILRISREAALRMHSPQIMPIHVLIGILRHGEGVAVQALQRQGVDLAALLSGIEFSLYENNRQNAASVTPEPVDEDDRTDDADEELQLNKESERALRLSQLEARMLHSTDIDTEHLFLAMLKDDHSDVSQLLSKYNVDYSSLHREVMAIHNPESEPKDKPAENPVDWMEDEEEEFFEPLPSPQSSGNTSSATARPMQDNSSTPALDKFGFDLTQAAAEGKLDPVVGREVEIERVVQILSRRKKNNPILIGEAGVGKSAIVEGLAHRIVEKKVSWLLQNKRVVTLDLAGLVAGTKYRGQFEERIKTIITELQNNRDVILFIDEIHTLVGAGNTQGGMDAANILKPALSRGEIQCIGATTHEEYRKSIEKDAALERRFQRITVEPTSPADTLVILQNIKDRYEEHHNVIFSDEALQACVDLTERYVSSRQFPDKAIDALDEAGSRMHLFNTNIPTAFGELEQEIAAVKQSKDDAILSQQFEEAATYRDRERQLEANLRQMTAEWEEQQKHHRPTIDAEMIAEVVAQMSGVPVTKVAASEGEKLLKLKDCLSQQIIGQDSAIARLVKAIQRNRVGLKDPRRPIGTFLFLGPTGVGKTYLAKKLAEEMFGSADNMIRIDMSEYMDKYSISRLIGAAPGYVGYDDAGQLTESVRKHPYSVVLFDEIEKASPEIFNLMLQIFDDGQLTDSHGRKVNFKNTIIIMTSNVGSRQLQDFGTGIGFATQSESELNQVAQGIIQKSLKKTFPPEFINRIDDIIHFDALTQAHIRSIVDLELNLFAQRIARQGYSLSIDDAARTFLAQRGYDKQYGARPLKRAIQTYVEDELCEQMLLHHQDSSLTHIRVSMSEPITAASVPEVVLCTPHEA